MVSRRFFLGGLAMSSATGAPLLETIVNDFELTPDRVFGLCDDDVLIMRVPDSFSDNDCESAITELRENVWPHVLIVPDGVGFDVLRRKKKP